MHRLVVVFTFVILLVLFSSGRLYATVKKAPANVRVDSSTVQVKRFNANAIKQFSNNKDFNYKGEAVGEPTVWERFWGWVWNKLGALFNKIPYGGSFFKYLLLAISIALLVYIISKSIGLDPFKLWQRSAQKMNIPYSESLENIHQISFDDEIEKAIAQHNYRLAVRLLYLKCLKQLNDAGLIQWQIDKTNSAYMAELTNPAQRQMFGLLTRQFEYVWYGDFMIDKHAFGNVNLLFQNFKKQLP